MWPLTCWLFLGILASVRAQIVYYTVPDAKLEALKPKGIRVSIPDELGVELFAFHGNLNKRMLPRDGGQLSMDIREAINGRWVFEDRRLRLKIGDTINYWLYVQVDGLGYQKDGLSWTVTEFVTDSGQTVRPDPTQTPTQSSSCGQTSTTHNGRPACRGQLILEDSFSSINRSLWDYDIRIANQPDYGFAVYNNHKENCYVKDGRLHITPTLLEKSTIEEGTLILEGCTGEGLECKKTAKFSDYLPPVASARLRTKHSFSFRYGRVEVRAKLPCGDWLFPELWLEPLENDYGAEFYRSGQIRLAMSRGNYQLVQRPDGTDIGSCLLEMGCVLGLDLKNVKQEMVHKRSDGESRWCEGFHNYQLQWTADAITFQVDDVVIDRVTAPPGGFGALKEFSRKSVPWTSGLNMAPFDKEFYLSVGLGVGGVRDFPDNCMSVPRNGAGVEKPWKNTAPHPIKDFHDDKDKWYPTWNGEDSALQVIHIKVWAL